MAIDMHRVSASATAFGAAKADVHRGVPRCSLLKRLIEGASISAIAIAAVTMASSNVRAAEPGAFTISAHDGASETVTGVQILSNRAIEATGAGSGVNLNDADVTVGIENPTDTTNARAGLQVTDGASANVVTSTLRTDGTLDYAQWQSSYWDDTAVDVSGNGSIATFTDSSIVAGADAVGVSGTGASVTLTNTNVQAGTSDAPTGYNGPGKGVAVRDGASATIEGGSITTSGSATQYWHGGAESPTGVPNNIVDKPLFRHSAQDGDSAIYVRGEGSNVDATDVVIQVAGSPGNNTADTSVNTRAVIALGGAQATLTGGSITTTGDARTTGVYVQAYSNLDGWLEDPRNADTSVTLNDVSIITEGAETGVGVKAYSNTKTADGLAPDGSDPHTQTVYINGGSISTSGEESYGLVAQNYGSTILADTWNGTGLAIDTAGVNAHGVVVYGAAEADLTGTSVTTTGAGALGLSVNVMGPLSAPSSSPSAGGVLFFNEGSIVTSGAQAMGAFARGAATATIGGTDIATTGADAIGLLLMDGAAGSLDNSSITTSGDAAHAVGVADGASITIAHSSLRADGADSSGVAMLNSANVEISSTEIASSGASFLSMLEQAGQVQDITLAGGMVAVENDGTLLRINRNVDGADGIVSLQLSDGANVAGDILDLDAKAGNGHSSVSVTAGAQYAGLIDGVRSLDATGGTAILADGSALDRITAGVGGVIEATNVTLRTSGKKEDAAVADGGNIQINGGTISTDYRRGPGGANAGINTHALLAVNGGLITGSDLVISGSNDGYFDGVVSVKAGSEIALSNSTISNEMPYSDFSAAGATADGEGAVLRLDGTSVSVASDCPSSEHLAQLAA